jgi:hemerythrin-like domain-containing protein
MMTHLATQVIRDEHASVAAVLRSLMMMIDQGPGDRPERFFDVLRAMLFYIDEFPEKQHHPKESDLLFPKLARAEPALMPIIRRLEAEHMKGEGRVRELQHMLVAWELLGDSRRAEFVEAANAYVAFYLDHMHLEETQILPAAQRVLTRADWAQLDEAFGRNRDPLNPGHRDPAFDRLFTRIVTTAPAPIGVGASLKGAAIAA